MRNQIKTNGTEDPFYTRSSFLAIILLLAISLAAKLPLLPHKWGIIAGDAIAYVSIAQLISQIDLKAAFSVSTILPFYPMLIAFFHAIGGS
jgi:hypothetical protein